MTEGSPAQDVLRHHVANVAQFGKQRGCLLRRNGEKAPFPHYRARGRSLEKHNEEDVMKHMSIAIALGFALGAGGLGWAQSGDRGGKMFDRVDINNDGRITLQEAQAFRNARFQRMDANNDGQVTQAEMQEARSKRRAQRAERSRDRMAKRFEKTDTNGNGALDRAEFERMAAERFARMDVNGDGAVTRDEIRNRRGRKKAE